ncbi:hypothetical protein BITS_1523 [Bifidobacterium tsurumiense]|uniref:Uncharacterized protein n=1 Tax=Bifidobacterium tsurumiense TaxID=356829 RepID=A0A087EH46_9BIFI|nr:hypothetical protein BITS_1523 [Bifidobacterium tsurumiense]
MLLAVRGVVPRVLALVLTDIVQEFGSENLTEQCSGNVLALAFDVIHRCADDGISLTIGTVDEIRVLLGDIVDQAVFGTPIRVLHLMEIQRVRGFFKYGSGARASRIVCFQYRICESIARCAIETKLEVLSRFRGT